MNFSIDDYFNNIDWNFPDLGNEGINSIHWYPATFISAIPGSIIPALTKKNDLVLDPFCGTSVTGIEATRMNRRFLGLDTNPVAVMISQSKLLFPSTKYLLELINEKDFFTSEQLTKNNKNDHPNSELLRKWYHPLTYFELLNIFQKINLIRNPSIKIPALSVFSSILRVTSSQNRHYGWVCDNVLPKPNEIVYKNANDIFRKALDQYIIKTNEFIKDLEFSGVKFKRSEFRKRWNVICTDAVTYLSKNETKFNLILTSPPYNGVADYIKAQRLTFLWFHQDYVDLKSLKFNDFKKIREAEIGARSKRQRKNSYSEYVNYMSNFISLAYNSLQKSGFLALIIGSSSAREDSIKILEDNAKNLGFIKVYEFERNIKESRTRLMIKVKTEKLIIYKK